MHYSLIPLVFLEIIILMIQLCSTSSGLTIDMTAANLVPSNQVASVRGRRSLGHDSSQRRQLRRGDFQHGGLSHSEFHIGRNQRSKRQVYNVFIYLHFKNLNISMVFPLTYKIYNAAQERGQLLPRGQQRQHHHDSGQQRQLWRGDFQHGGLSHSEFHIGINQQSKRQVYNVFHYLHFMNLNISMVFPQTYKIYNAAQERRQLLRRGQQWQHHHRRRPSHRARHLAGHAHADVRRPRHRGRRLAGHAHADVRRDMRVSVN